MTFITVHEMDLGEIRVNADMIVMLVSMEDVEDTEVSKGAKAVIVTTTNDRLYVEETVGEIVDMIIV